MKELALAFVLLALGAALTEARDDLKCPPAYSHCNLGKPGFINFHIVPHTHDDVGWLKTVDQYYYGSNLGQQDARVQYILGIAFFFSSLYLKPHITISIIRFSFADTVVDELAKDPSKRFVYVEIAYFWRWWNQQNDETKQLVRSLVDKHRLEFVIAGWCMSDEATTYYNDMIDQQALGLKFILKEFGPCARPRSAWYFKQILPS
jgi:lysosomal alpha-mannosidase